MPLEARASALVAGSNPGGGGAAETEVRVVRAFCVRGERQEPGSVIKVSPAFARELIFVGKAEAYTADVVPPAPPAPESPGSGKKEKSHARK